VRAKRQATGTEDGRQIQLATLLLILCLLTESENVSCTVPSANSYASGKTEFLYISISERQSQSKLSNTRGGCRLRESEVRCGDTPLHILELGMIEDVEELCPELQTRGLCQLRTLQQGQVEIISSRTMEEAAAGISQLPQWLPAEQRSVEIWLPGAGIPDVQRSRRVTRGVDVKNDGSGKRCAQEGTIVGLVDHNRQPGREACNTAHLPSIGQPFGPAQLIKRQAVVVTDNEIVGCVEGGKGSARRVAHWVDLLAIAGSIIDRLAVGVCHQRLQPIAGMAKIDLERVVVGVANRCEVAIALERIRRR